MPNVRPEKKQIHNWLREKLLRIWVIFNLSLYLPKMTATEWEPSERLLNDLKPYNL